MPPPTTGALGRSREKGGTSHPRRQASDRLHLGFPSSRAREGPGVLLIAWGLAAVPIPARTCVPQSPRALERRTRPHAPRRHPRPPRWPAPLRPHAAQAGPGSDKVRAIAERQVRRIAALAPDRLVLYDLQDEATRTDAARPFPFLAHARAARLLARLPGRAGGVVAKKSNAWVRRPLSSDGEARRRAGRRRRDRRSAAQRSERPAHRGQATCGGGPRCSRPRATEPDAAGGALRGR